MKPNMRGLLVSLLLLFAIAVPVSASGFSLSPLSAELTIADGSSSEIAFDISGYQGMLEIGLEGLEGFQVKPTSIYISDSQSVTLVIKDVSADVGNYNGKLTFLAINSDGVSVGYKVKTDIEVVSSTSIVSKFILTVITILFVIILSVWAYRTLKRRRGNETS